MLGHREYILSPLGRDLWVGRCLPIGLHVYTYEIKSFRPSRHKQRKWGCTPWRQVQKIREGLPSFVFYESHLGKVEAEGKPRYRVLPDD